MEDADRERLPVSSGTSDVQQVLDQLANEREVAQGAEGLLLLLARNAAQDAAADRPELRAQVETELRLARARIHDLELRLSVLGQEEGSLLEERKSVTPRLMRALERTTSVSSDPPFLATGDAHHESFTTSFELVSDLLRSLAGTSDPRDRVTAMDSIVKAVEQQVRIKYELKLEDSLPSVFSCLSDEAGKDVRAGIYRLLRHLIVDAHDITLLDSYHLPLYLVRSLTRDQKCETEKDQALRLIRLLLSLPDADRPVSAAVVRAVVAIADAPEEKLRLASLETLGELVVRDVGLLVESEGLRVLLDTLSTGPFDLSPYLAMGFTWVMDGPSTRRFLRPGVDIEIVLSSFTNPVASLKGHQQEDRIRASAKIVAYFAKSWSGLIYLSTNNRLAISSLVDALKSPSLIVREALLDTLFDIFRFRTPVWFKSTLASPPPSRPVTSATLGTSNLIDQFLAILLLVFIDAGLLTALVAVAETPRDGVTSKKISLLIGEILQLSNRVLPLSYATQVQALPRLFSLASSFDSSDGRLAASSTLSTVDSLNRSRSRMQVEPELEARASTTEAFARSLRQVEDSKLSLAKQIDDLSFRNALLETSVLSTKDATKWSLPILFDLLGGPLLNPKRLDEAMRGTKVVRRLLGFLHPFNHRYSDVKRAKGGDFERLGCRVLETLLGSPDGVRFLGEDKLVRQIADCLFQLDPARGPTYSTVLFSKSRMESTISPGYFSMIGVLSRSRDGLKILEANKVFTALHRILELRGREDLTRGILDCLDYTSDGHARVLLSRALTSASKRIRLLATTHLAVLLAVLPAKTWQIRLLLTQLYDSAPEVSLLALEVLQTVCNAQEALERVVQMRPQLEGLMEEGREVLMRFLSTSVGLSYLVEIDFVETEMEDWLLERNYLYVVQIELLLASALGTDGCFCTPTTTFDGTLPPHFYGELVKTREGCQLLAASGHFAEFANYIRNFGLEEEEGEIIAGLKSALWAVGQIGASKGGLAFLDEEWIVQSIVEIAEDSPVFSLRGTAYFVLGLISSTIEGAEILEELGWESVLTPLGQPVGICVPFAISNFVDTPLWDPPPYTVPSALSLAAPSSSLEREALTAFSNLSNHILSTAASKSLARLKVRHPELFSSPALYYRVMEILGSSHYRLLVRRYVVELFDLALDRAAVKGIMDAGEAMRVHSRETEGNEGEEVERGGAGTGSKMHGSLLEPHKDDGMGGEEVSIPLKHLVPLVVSHGFAL